MASGSRVSYRNLYNNEINEDRNYFLINLRSCLIDEKGGPSFGVVYMKLYEKAYKMVHYGHSDDLYSCVRALLIEYIDNSVKNLEDSKTNDFLSSLNDLWFKFLKKMEFVRNVLLYSERVFETSVLNGSMGRSITYFIWNNFRDIILENNNFNLELKNNKNSEEISLVNDFQVLNLINIELVTTSNILNIDCLLDVFSFFSIPQLIKFSLISSQMDKISTYILNKRSHKLCSIKICKDWQKKSYGIYQLNLPKKRLGTLFIPLNSLPVWINGINTIQFIKPNYDCIEFLKLFKNYLHNCHLSISQTVWKNLHENGQLLTFLKLLDDQCFSFEQKIIKKDIYKNVGIIGELFSLMWPIWAIFNEIFLKQCKDISLSLDILYFNGTSFIKWLHNSITENKPRRLKLFGGTNEYRFDLDIFSLIQKIKEYFMLSSEKRMFYIQFPFYSINLSLLGEWNNQIGEKLVIDSSLISRLPLEYSQNKFEDFYEHLNEINLPKIEIF
ncbi:hypothetical protein Mgra_00007255 [Meloidogyne graminicola]|uniref:Cullin N-terminal domain-containing protein n=1 Tax=Meloidogyne graminicola TaxID=189291 RepID=A0A8S9ZIZ5_9BILA|nr:hypothetical protein Mgra_00007255 [Meloidogyne graminicola]